MVNVRDLTAGLEPEDLQDSWRARPDTLAWKWSGGLYTPAPHHQVLAQAIVECVTTPDGRLLVEMPPRHGKSELTSKWTPAWVLQLWPHWRVLLASYGGDFASEWGGAARDIIIEHGYPYGVEVSADTHGKSKWTTTAGGGMWTAGVDGVFTGRGGNLIVIDDPHKNWIEASSETMRQHVWDWYLSTAYSRLAPGGSIIVVQTRWHEDDLGGRLEKASKEGTGETWRVIRMPAIATETERHVASWTVEDSGDLAPVEWARDKGDVLWPTQFDKANIETKRSTLGPIIFSALYQQKPSPGEGSILKRGWWRRYKALPPEHERDDALISVDSSFKGLTDSDYVVIQVWWKFGGRKYLIAQVRDQMDYPTFKKSLREMALRHPECRKILVEDSANGPAVVSDLGRTISGLLLRPARGSKESRAHAVTGDIESGNVYLPDAGLWSEVVELIEECAVFPKGLHDDQVDALTQALLEWPNMVVQQQGTYSAMDVLRGRGR